MSRIAPQSPVPVEPEPRRAFRSADIQAAMKAQENRCIWCPAPLKGFHCDHRVPRDLGGPTTLANLWLMCVACHGRKTVEDRKAIDKARRLRTGPKPKRRRIRSRGFDKSKSKRMNGKVEPR